MLLRVLAFWFLKNGILSLVVHGIQDHLNSKAAAKRFFADPYLHQLMHH
jgi:hypothetical protein